MADYQRLRNVLAGDLRLAASVVRQTDCLDALELIQRQGNQDLHCGGEPTLVYNHIFICDHCRELALDTVMSHVFHPGFDLVS